MDDNDFAIMDALFAEVKRLNSELQLEDTETKPDGKCREDDGCPTENAVLRREWRKLTEQLAAVTAERDAAKDAVNECLRVRTVVHCELCKKNEDPDYDCTESGCRPECKEFRL